MPVVCTAPLGHKTKVCQPLHFHWPPLKGLLICLLLPAYPYTGLHFLLMSFGRKIYLPAIDFVCILLLLFYFCLLFLLNILFTKNVYFRICFSYWHISLKSLNFFFLWDIPFFVIHYSLAVLIPAYVCALCRLRLLLFLPAFTHIIF